jgi:transcriptional regulator with XRE-family HTH domain
MFEIGNSLRETRRRQGLELDDVAQATLIRTRYLDALEQERFELLPDGFYRRSFLRRYADHLGLDGDLYVDEFELRFGSSHAEPELAEPRVVQRSAARRRPNVRPLVGLAIVAVLALVGWELAGSSSSPPHRPGAGGHDEAGSHSQLVAVPASVVGTAALPAPRVLVLTAARGTCWVEVRVGSASGTTLYSATLQQGRSLRFGIGRPLWIRLGAPENLDATMSGRSVTAELPSAPTNILASAQGLESVP